MQTIQIRLTKELVNKSQQLVDRGLYSNKSEVFRDAIRRLTFSEELTLDNKRNFNIIFTSDLHGNIQQYKKLFQKAYSDCTDAIIIGGDIAPKDPKNRTIKGQKIFLEKELFPRIKEFNNNNKKRQHSCPIYILLGNDDYRSNVLILKKNGKKIGFIPIHNNCIKLHEDFKIAGYSYVPLTPFVHKDWEKLDLSDETETKLRKDMRLNGNKARGNGFVDVKFNLKYRKSTIEKDLKKLLRGSSEKILLVTHAPPYNTVLDMINAHTHVGSAAIRKLIEKKQPFMTLHGHIHETVDVSGNFKSTIGKTISVCSGNDHRYDSLAIIKFNLYNPEKAIRELI